jgi:hypothetical protein
MNLSTRVASRYLTALAAASLLSIGVATAAPASAQTTASRHAVGYLQLAHLSPNTPPVDVYLYSFGNPKAMIVLKHVSYGTVSPFETVASGDYTVAMRGAGAAPSTKPVLSTSVDISPGGAYTVAGMGPEAGLRLEVIKDRLSAPKGRALVRVIQASLRQHVVSLQAGQQDLTSDQAFATISPYRTLKPGRWHLRAAGGDERATAKVGLHADGIYTLVVMDDPGHLAIATLEDAAGSKLAPSGGADTGFGGTANPPSAMSSAMLPWAAVLAAGLALILGGLTRRRTRPHGR